MKLDDTVDMMISSDYKERFKAEYFQTKIRRDSLSNMLDRYKEGTLSFTPTCSYEILFDQLVILNDYITILEERAIIEQVDISDNQ